MKKAFHFLTTRMFWILFAAAIELAGMTALMVFVGKYFAIVQFAVKLIAIIIAFVWIAQNTHPTFKVSWLFMILVVPVFGIAAYIMFGRKNVVKKVRNKVLSLQDSMVNAMPDDEALLAEIKKADKSVASQMGYVSNVGGYPVFQNTDCKYYKCGEDMYPDMLEDIRKAQKYIYIEYFIFNLGHCLDQLLTELEIKAKEGVDIRLIYDDWGCVNYMPRKKWAEIKAMGIKCVVCSPFKLVPNALMNNRDHRKILLIDGKVAYTGGLNISDEYINEKERFGYWKDTGVRLEGEATFSLEMIFLNNWGFANGTDIDFEAVPKNFSPQKSGGYVQPYAGSPLLRDQLTENVYMNIISKAKDYVYIFTPYLILGNDLQRVIENAVACGVDVRIVVPGVPDKKTVYELGHKYFYKLAQKGVKIYKYKPGFIHAKSVIADDEIATVGSINMDYRSLYLHYENGVYFYKGEIIDKIKDDFMTTFEESILCEASELKGNWFNGFIRTVLELVAPLL